MRTPRRVLVVLLALASFTAAADDPTAKLYATRCQPCHGVRGNAAKEEMNLADDKWIHGSSLEDMTRVIENGVPGKAMLAFKEMLSPEEIAALARYVQAFSRKSKKARGDKP